LAGFLLTHFSCMANSSPCSLWCPLSTALVGYCRLHEENNSGPE
jgi:hypothetical protein